MFLSGHVPVAYAWLDVEGKTEGNVLFNDDINTFHGYMVKEYSNKTSCLHYMQYVLQINSKRCFIYNTRKIIHTTIFIIRVVEHWLECLVEEAPLLANCFNRPDDTWLVWDRFSLVVNH